MNKLRLARFLLGCWRWLPKRHAVKTSGLVAPFFIFNAGRSGSTLINRMLNEHPEIGLPSEQYFLGPAIFKYQFYNYLLWRDLIQVIVGELWDVKKHTWNLDIQKNIRSIITWTGKERSLQRIIEVLYREVVAENIWGDSTPLNVVYCPEIYRVFPQAKYIFLLRDGRDVVASYRAGGSEAFGDLADLESACRRWVLAMEHLEWLKNQTSVLEVTYEDLVRDPQVVMNRICQHLSVSEFDNWRDYPKNIPDSSFYEPSHHDAIRQMPFRDSIGKWKEALNSEEQAYCHRLMGRHLKRQGYI